MFLHGYARRYGFIYAAVLAVGALGFLGYICPGVQSPARASHAVLWAAGDIADCATSGDETTAAFLARQEGTVAVPGDLAYPSGTRAQFRDCYGPSWGQLKERTRPAPGNHEYETPGASGYFTYFWGLAGPPSRGYYAYLEGAWLIISLNSNCEAVGCGQGSHQVRWLEAVLHRFPRTCTLAYWHHPVFSSGDHGNDSRMRPIFEVLHSAGADIVLTGHDHSYERFAAQDAGGSLSPEGITQFVVGTGGKSLRTFPLVQPNSETRLNDTFGVLRLVLRPAGYEWQFIGLPEEAVLDSGTGSCH